MTATPSQNHQSPHASSESGGGGGGGGGDGGVNSPQKRKNLPSPWAQVVRGGEHDLIPSTVTVTVNHLSSSFSPPSVQLSSLEQSSSDCSSPSKTASYSPPPYNSVVTESSDGTSGNGGTKKAAWNKPLNGVTELRPVMGATLWPPLPKASAKSPSQPESSSKTVSDVSAPNSQVPVMPQSPQKVTTNDNAKSNSTQSHRLPARQRSMRRNGNDNSGGSNNLQSGFNHLAPPQPPPLPPYPLYPMPPPGGYNMVVPLPDQSPRDPPYRASHWEARNVVGYVPRASMVNDHRHSSRRNNIGPRGEGTYHNNMGGGRRDQNRGRHGSAREDHVQPQRALPRGFTGYPPNTVPFTAPPHMPAYVNPMAQEYYYVSTYNVDPYRGMPIFPQSPVPAMIMPASDVNLSVMLVNQIEYYFSDANLVKDGYLRSNMDEQGWVPLTLIAGFNRVKSMTLDIQLILQALRTSTLLEVQSDKVRRRNDWMKWIPTKSASDSSCDLLSSSLQKISMDELTSNHDGMTANSSLQSEDAPSR